MLKNLIIFCLFCLVLTSCNQKEEKSDSELNEELSLIEKNQYKKDTSDRQPEHKPVNQTEGKDYNLLKNPYATENKDKVVVYEFFGYTCPHCYHFEPFLNDWNSAKPDYVQLIRVPLNFHESWAIYQQAYLTAEVMGVAERAHNKLFEDIHANHKSFRTIEDLAQWYADNTGVNKEEFLSTADSFILDSKLRQADKMGYAMQISGTPSVVVNGKYILSNRVKDRKQTISTLNYLIRKEAEEMGLDKK